MNELLWAVFPYVSLTLFFVVPFIRFVFRPYGLTTRASSMFNRDVLGLASLLLHWGIILVFVGHVIGLIGGILGLSGWISLFFWLGLVGGVFAIVGSAIALIRRHMVPEVRALSQLDDYLVHYFLISIIGIALYQSVVDQIWGVAYAGSAWFASLFRFQPEPELIAGAGLLSKIHIFLGFAFAAYFPFTKLIHVWTYPVNYFVRPYQVMRTQAHKFQGRWEYALRSDKSFLTYTVASFIVILVGIAFLLNEPTLDGLSTARVEPADGGAMVQQARAQEGYALYISQCASCHGTTGKGDGPGMNSPTFGTLPRDLSLGQYRFVSTQSGIAHDADLRHVVVNGLPSSGMPAFQMLSDRQIDSLVGVLNHMWKDRPDPGPRVAMTPAPRASAALSAAGKVLYADNCAMCHGDTGAGDGPAAEGIEDFPGHLLPPANLLGGGLKAGSSPMQLYYRVAAGISAGDTMLMPPFDYLTPEEIWSIVVYLREEVLPKDETAAAQGERNTEGPRQATAVRR